MTDNNIQRLINLGYLPDNYFHQRELVRQWEQEALVRTTADRSYRAEEKVEKILVDNVL